jgi:hypothetical protein
VRIHLAVEHALQLELAYSPLEPCGILLDVRGSALVVFAFRKLKELCGIGDGLGSPVQLLELGGELGAFATELTGLVRVLPDRGILQLSAYLFEAFLLRVVLKETP